MPIISSELFNNADSYRKQFDTAKPFRHVLIPQFFDPAIAEAVLAEFPVPRENEMITSFQAGYTLTADDTQELKIAFVRRNGFLQGMYQREWQLLMQIDNRTKA